MHSSLTPASAAATAARFSLLRGGGGGSAASAAAAAAAAGRRAAAAGATPAREDGVRRLSFTDRPPSPVMADATPYSSALDLAAARVAAALAADTPTPEALARIARGRAAEGGERLSVSWSTKIGGGGAGQDSPDAALISAARTPLHSRHQQQQSDLSTPAAVERSLRLEAEQLRKELHAARAQAAAGAGATAKAAAEAGLFAAAGTIALLSISLGVINLLPVPVLDGGQIVMYAAEWVRGRPLPYRLRERLQQIGVLLLVSLFLVVSVWDVQSCVRGGRDVPETPTYTGPARCD